jgi:hypothetical protein
VTRSVDLASVIDDSADLFNGQLVWLAGSSTLAILPADELPELVAGGPTVAARHQRRGCGDRSRSGCVILIRVPRTGPLRYLRRITAPDLDVTNIAAVASDEPDQLIVASDSSKNTTRIDTISLTDSSTRLAPLLSIPGASPEAFDSTGSHLIYAIDQARRLLIAAIGPRGLTDRRVLDPNAEQVQVGTW